MTRPGHGDAVRSLSLALKAPPTSGGDFSYTKVLAGVTGEVRVHGAQSQGVGIWLKHSAADNRQTTDRLRVNAAVGVRTGPGIPSHAPRGVCWSARLGG